MTHDHSQSRYVELVRRLCRIPTESELVEFKHNVANPQEIGEYISALSNAAALDDKPYGYLIWGIEDVTHNIVGTSFDPATAGKGNERLENWLAHLLKPRLDFRFHVVDIDAQRVVLLVIPSAFRHPVRSDDVTECGQCLFVGSENRNGSKVPPTDLSECASASARFNEFHTFLGPEKYVTVWNFAGYHCDDALVLLRHKILAAFERGFMICVQHGHRGRVFANAWAIRRLRVAIE